MPPRIRRMEETKNWRCIPRQTMKTILSLFWNCKIDEFHALFSVYASFQLFKYWSDGRIASTSALKRQLPSFIIHQKIHKNLHCLAVLCLTRTVNFWILPVHGHRPYMGPRILRFTLQILKTCMQSINIFSRATSKFFNLFLKEPKEHPLQTLKICVAKHLEFLAHRPYRYTVRGCRGPPRPLPCPAGEIFFKKRHFLQFSSCALRALASPTSAGLRPGSGPLLRSCPQGYYKVNDTSSYVMTCTRHQPRNVDCRARLCADSLGSVTFFNVFSYKKST